MSIRVGSGGAPAHVEAAWQRRRRRTAFMFVLAGSLALMALGKFGWVPLSGPSDGIEEGKIYRLAATYRVAIEQGKGQKTLPGRVFDFADRNLPRASVAVPLTDGQGILLVRMNQNLPKSTIRKVRVQVPRRVMEGVAYPGYEYVSWEYNLATVEVQGVEPPVIPKR